MDRDVIAVGTGNLCAAMVGGLPMISEIVRSRANIDNGAKTKFANFWHGMFLLVCVALIPTILHRIPLAALAGMLVYTGFRLAHPQEFINVYRIGREQLAIFVTTLIAVLATDLLIGIGIGIALKIGIHMANGVSFQSLFRPDLAVQDVDARPVEIRVGQAAIFSNWIPLRREIEQSGLLQGKSVVLNMADTKLVDHSVMDKIHEMEMDFEQQQLELKVIGLDGHLPVAQHALSARRRKMARVSRITVIAPPELESLLETEFVRRGATGYTAIQARGAGKHDILSSVYQGQATHHGNHPRVRIEVIATTEVCLGLLEYISKDVLPNHPITACVETVDVLRLDAFSN
jgi:MFS superfamily sulfate permease-like transporter